MASAKDEEKIASKVRALCLELPSVNERLSHGSPAFFINDKKTFCTLHHDWKGNGEYAIQVAAPPGAQEALIAADPDRYYRPAYVGGRGWVGMRLERKVDWDEVAGVIEDAFCTVAPAKLVAMVR
jgi:hypothetical protein